MTDSAYKCPECGLLFSKHRLSCSHYVRATKAPTLKRWRWHVLDTQVKSDGKPSIAAVYGARRDADAFVKRMSNAWPGRYTVLDTGRKAARRKDPTGLGRLVGGFFKE